MFIKCIWLNNIQYKNFEKYKIHSEKDYIEGVSCFLLFGWFLYLLVLEFVAPKTYALIFYNSSFFTKIFMHYYIHMWKITSTMQIIIISNLNIFHVNFLFKR
jgi:hypothetical protein